MDYPIFGFVLFSFFLAYSVECAILQVLQYDQSFHQFCEGYSGSYTKRKDLDAIIGDVCILTISKAGLNVDDNQKRMRNHCRNWYPYHLRSVKNIDGNSFSCELENPHICNRGWVYIDGGCYKLMGKTMHVDFDFATGICKHQGGIAQDRYNLGGWLDLYYPEMSQIWMLGVDSPLTEIYEKNLTQAATIIAYGSANTWSTSWAMPVQINKKELALVVCEYFPPSTPPSRRILTDRLKPILKIDFTREHLHLTTSNLYSSYNDKMKSYEKICQSYQAMFPSIAFGFRAFVPKMEDVKILTRTMLEKSPVRLPIQQEMKKELIEKSDVCPEELMKLSNFFGYTHGNETEKVYKMDEFLYRAEWYHHDMTYCWLIVKSGALIWHDQKAMLTRVSDVQRAPLLCSADLVGVNPNMKLCPEGDTTFDRPTGERVCFFIMKEGQRSWDEFNDICKRGYGGVGLAGFETEQEYKVLNQLRGSQFVYLGAQREEHCRKSWGYRIGHDTSSPDALCGQKNIFSWQNGVASNSKESREVMGKFWGKKFNEPNNAEGIENCMEFDEALNDIFCNKRPGAICQRLPSVNPPNT